jgi:polyhydroxyalkanoate synthesis regulator phasin
MQDSELSYILQSLAKKAKIQNGSKRIRFHCLRKYLSDRLSSAMSESKWKQIVGKKISEGAYINADSLREDFLKAMPNIAISTNGSNGKVLELEKKVDNLNQMVEFYREESMKSEEEIVGGQATVLIERIDALERKIAKLQGKKQP